MKAQPRMLERILAHLETEPFLDLLVRMLHDPVVPDIAEVRTPPSPPPTLADPHSNHAQWFSSQNLVPRLVALLSAHHRPDMHAVVAELVSRIVSMAAPSPGGAGLGDTGQPAGPASNRFARELARRENVDALVSYILLDFAPAGSPRSPGTLLLPDAEGELPSLQSATSSAVHAIAAVVELIRKNNSDYFEPYLFHTLRNRLIHVQQQHAGGPEDVGRAALERAMQEMVEKMGVVHLGPVLEVVCERVQEFQAYLAKPRSSVR